MLSRCCSALASSLLELDMSCSSLNNTWAATFGEAAVCSAVLRTLRLNRCGLRGPLPELRLPALQVLDLSGNAFTGGLEPVQHCTALRHLELHGQNKLTGSLEPLRGCATLQRLYLLGNPLTPTEEDKAHFQKQCPTFDFMWLTH